jgi:4-carboxymuconolactone decarboxylase
MKTLVAVTLSMALLSPALAADEAVQVSRAGTRTVATAPAQNFTGAVKVEMLHTPSAAQRTSAGSVSFAPGSRTAWHSHPLGQTLIVTAGVGRVQRWGGPVEEIRTGDVVRIAPGVKHWHGAARDSAMTHIAITEALDGKTADWQEQVTDAQVGDAKPAGTQPNGSRTGAQPTRPQALLGDVALFGDVWARPGLSPRDRSLVTVSALIAMNRPEQLRSHLARALDNGMSKDEISEALTHLAFYAGWPTAIGAAGVAREVFASRP